MHIISCNFCGSRIWERPGSSSLKSLMRLYPMLIWASLLMGWLELEDLLLEWFSHITGNLVMAVHRKPQVFSIWTFSPGCLSVLTTWWLVSPSVSNPKAQGDAAMCFIISPWISHTITLSIFYWSPKASLFNMGGHYTRTYISENENL